MITAFQIECYSKATPEFEADGLENLQDLIAFCAKVSNPTAQINKETSERLIKYLIKHHHWSPLEMVNATLEIETTRDIAHQIVRHRSFAFQEFSQRYADPKTMGDMFILSEARMQDTKNRQNSIETEDDYISERWEEEQLKVIEQSQNNVISGRLITVLQKNKHVKYYQRGLLSHVYICKVVYVVGFIILNYVVQMEHKKNIWKLLTHVQK